MHIFLSILAIDFFSQCIAPTGQTLLQRPHFLQILSSTSNLTKAEHTPAGQILSFIWLRYSSLKYLRVLKTGLVEVCPRPHNDADFISCPNSKRRSRSLSLACPLVILSNISFNRFPNYANNLTCSGKLMQERFLSSVVWF